MPNERKIHYVSVRFIDKVKVTELRATQKMAEIWANLFILVVKLKDKFRLES
jgi:hypothetical protein